MRSHLRRLLWLLLMLALPLQGITAVTLRLCGPMHGHGGMHPAVGTHAEALRAATTPDDPGSAVAAAHDCHDAAATVGSEDDSSDADAGAGRCSACAACCLAAVPAAEVPDLGHPGLVAQQADVAVAPEARGRPERLERPPRLT